MLRTRVFRPLAAVLIAAATIVIAPLATASPAAADGCFTWSRTLRQGMVGNDVTQLQIRVAGWPGSFGEVISIDGNFGPRTKAAVARFQTAYGLSSDGVAGTNTFNKIYELQDDDCTPVHFTFAEVTRSATCGSQASLTGGSVGPAEVRSNLIRAMWRAEALRHQLGDRALTVTSGFRSQSCDRRVGGSGTGQHTFGRAIDFSGTPSFCQLAQQARSAGFNGIFGPNSPSNGHQDHVHVDIRPSRSWAANQCGVSGIAAGAEGADNEI